MTIEHIVKKEQINGTFEKTIKVKGFPITVRGYVDKEGVVKIGTFFIK